MYRFIILFLFFIPITLGAAPLNRYTALPEPILTPFRAFAIPFEVLPNNSADPSNEIELLVSADQGKKWFSAGKTGIATKQFQFKAENDGEYWFSFRTITLSGAVKQSSANPQLRVIIQPVTASPSEVNQRMPQTDGSIQTVVQSPHQSAVPPQPDADTEIHSLKHNKPEYGAPVSPPKPPRLDEVKEKPAVKAAAAPQVSKSAMTLSEKYRQMPLLSTATGDVIKPDERAVKKNENESVPIEELFSRLNQFYGGKLSQESIIKIQTADSRQQTAEERTANDGSRNFQVAEAPFSAVGTVNIDKPQACRITGVSLNASGTQPQIIVKWNRGEEIWGEAAKGIMVDVFRGSTPQGTWLPLTTNLKNSGEYWWFISQDDLSPFYLMIRFRTLDGIAASDFTPSPILINPKLLNK